MKSKVGAMKFSIIAIILSFAIYYECQTNFDVCYIILNTIAHGFNNLFLKVNMTQSKFYYIAKCIYTWLLKQPGEVIIECLKMISSGIFGSAIVTLLVYYVEYKIQLKDAIYNLIKIQKKHVKQLNDITYISAFIDDENDIKRNAYLEYAQNSLKLRSQEISEQRFNQNKNLSQKIKKEAIERNCHGFEYNHEYVEKYKEWVWKQVPEDKKALIETGYKNQYLYDEIGKLFFGTDFELVAAFYDYREILEKDISDIEKMTNEIYFLIFQKQKKQLIEEALELDKKYIRLIQSVLGSCFEIKDFYDYFKGNRDTVLGNIEILQRKFFENNLESTLAAKEFEDWYTKVKKDILGEPPHIVSFEKPKNKFEIYGMGYALLPEFLRKARIQDWDYNKYTHFDLCKMGYK